MMPEPLDHPFTSLVMLASAPCVAIPGVSVLPSSVMSGPPFPLVRALVQSVTRLPQGIKSTTTLVLLYWGNCVWNCATTPFIQVTWEGADEPIRHTVSFAGAAAADVPPPPALEPQPAAAPASATTAPIAAADLVKFTGGSPFPASFLVFAGRAASCGRTPPALLSGLPAWSGRRGGAASAGFM